MVLVSRQGSILTKEQIEQIVEDKAKSTFDKINELSKKFDGYIKTTQEFRSKLEAEISRSREMNGEIADRFDKIMDEFKDPLGIHK